MYLNRPGDTVSDPFAESAKLPADQVVGPEVTDVPVAHMLYVNHDNVLQAAKIIGKAIDRGQAAVTQRLGDLRVKPMASDPVSVEAATVWNDCLLDAPSSYQARVTQYFRALNGLFENLIVTARGYGYDEDDITAMMHSIKT